MVCLTDFLAETVFWILSFCTRNDSKMAFLEKNPLKHALFTLQHYPSSWQQKSSFRRKQKTGLKFFQTSLLNFSESTLLLSAAWVVLRSKQSIFQKIFLKKSQFVVISDEKRQFSKLWSRYTTSTYSMIQHQKP